MDAKYTIGLTDLSRSDLAEIAEFGFEVMNSDNPERDRSGMDQAVVLLLEKMGSAQIQRILALAEPDILQAAAVIFAQKADEVVALPF